MNKEGSSQAQAYPPDPNLFSLAENDGSHRFSSGLLFEIVGTNGCIESRERSGDGLLRLNRTILARVATKQEIESPASPF